MANRLAGLSIETDHGPDANPIRGCREETASKDKSGRAEQGSNATTPDTAGKVMPLISGRGGGGECRTFRLESEDMFVNPFAGPWNDEAVLVQFRHDLASHPEKLEEILAAYVRQDPALAPRLLAMALARRPHAAIKLASVAASAGSLGRMSVLGLLLAATTTGVFCSSDQGNAADPKSTHPADINEAPGSALMSASAIATFLVGAGSAFATSSSAMPTSGGGESPWPSGIAARGDEAIGSQPGAGANAAAGGPITTSYGDRTNFGSNAEATGSGYSTSSPFNHAVTQDTAQTTAFARAITHPASPDGAPDSLRGNDIGNHWGHVAEPAAGLNDQPGNFSIFAEDHNPGPAGGFDRTSSEKGTDTDAPSATALGDTLLGAEKGAGSGVGVGTETVSSFLGTGAAASSPTGITGFNPFAGLANNAVDIQQIGQSGMSSPLSALNATHGPEQIVSAGIDGTGWVNGPNFSGLQSATGESGPLDAVHSSGLAPANGAPLGLDGLTSALKEIGSAAALPFISPALALNALTVPEMQNGSFLSLSEPGAGAGLPSQAESAAPASGAASQIVSPIGVMTTSFLHGIESGGSGAGFSAASLPLTNNGQVTPPVGSSLPAPSIADVLHSGEAPPTQAAAGANPQTAVPVITEPNHASNAIASSVNHTLVDALAWQSGSSGGEHGVTMPALADWTHVGFGHSG